MGSSSTPDTQRAPLSKEEAEAEAYVCTYQRLFPGSRIRDSWERAGAIRPRDVDTSAA